MQENFANCMFCDSFWWHFHIQQVDIVISKNQALRILYLSSIIPCIIIINFIVYNDTVLQCYTQTYLI